MKDKTVIVTGATAGIGEVTALEIARMGAHVVIIARNEAKAQETATMIRRTTGNEKVDFLLADLSSLAQTRAVAAQFKAKYDRLDVLVNNAGSLFVDYTESVDGLEMTFALNHLAGYFLLTNELLDVLKDSAPARIVSVASGAHLSADLNFDDLQMQQKYSSFRQYANSKLMNILFTNELARQLDGTGVTATSLHPGMVITNFGLTNNKKWYMRPAKFFFNLRAISAEEGAATSIYLATSPEVEGVTGQYFYECRAKRPSDAALDEANQQRLWAVSADLARL